MHSPDLTSHIRKYLSWLPDTNFLESLEKFKLQTPSLCAIKVLIQLKVEIYHNFIVKSSLPVAKIWSFFENSTTLTLELCPFNV